MLGNLQKPLYLKIFDHLKKEILSNTLQPGERLPTEMELAELFGVSRITSKRALEELEKEGLIYRKRGQGSFALSTKDRKKDNLGNLISMILPTDNTGGRRIEYIRGATDYLNQEGYYLSIHTTFDDPDKEKEYLMQLSRNGVKGIIYYPSNQRNFDILCSLSVEEFPIVLIDKKIQSLPLSSVASNNIDGGYQAVSHLIQLGHRRIAYIAYVMLEDLSSVKERFLGYCKALKDNDIPIDLDIVRAPIGGSEKSGKLRQVIDDLIRRDITAIFTEHDYLAIGVARTLSSMNIRIPEQVSVVGFDNVEILDHLDLKLTTIDQDFYSIGEKAAKLLLRYIRNGKYEYEEESIPVRLILRESTARLERQTNIQIFDKRIENDDTT